MDDPFAINIAAVGDLIGDQINKIDSNSGVPDEGIESEKYDAYEVKTSDEDLLKLRDEYEERYAPYEAVLKTRVEKIRNSYLGKRSDNQWLPENDVPIASNLQFEAEET